MKRIFALAAAFGLILAGSAFDRASAQDTPADVERKVIYLFNQDYPPAGIVQHPTHPVSLTKFWQVLDKQMRESRSLALSESLEDADYRVEIKCAGITHCSKLRVYIKSPQRDVLSAFTLHKVKAGLFTPSAELMDNVASRLAQRLQESIDALEEGGYGYRH